MNDKLRERAEKIYSSMFIAYEADANDKKDGLEAIEQSLLQIDKEAYMRGVREAVEIAFDACDCLGGSCECSAKASVRIKNLLKEKGA